jgi:predicted DNA-binding transcriptional regulator AlpA
MRRLIRYKDLRRLFNITWTRQHVLRLQKKGLFPKSFKLPGSHINCWYEDEVTRWLASLNTTAPRPSQ